MFNFLKPKRNTYKFVEYLFEVNDKCQEKLVFTTTNRGSLSSLNLCVYTKDRFEQWQLKEEIKNVGPSDLGKYDEEARVRWNEATGREDEYKFRNAKFGIGGMFTVMEALTGTAWYY